MADSHDDGAFTAPLPRALNAPRFTPRKTALFGPARHAIDRTHSSLPRSQSAPDIVHAVGRRFGNPKSHRGAYDVSTLGRGSRAASRKPRALFSVFREDFDFADPDVAFLALDDDANINKSSVPQSVSSNDDILTVRPPLPQPIPQQHKQCPHPLQSDDAQVATAHEALASRMPCADQTDVLKNIMRDVRESVGTKHGSDVCGIIDGVMDQILRKFEAAQSIRTDPAPTSERSFTVFKDTHSDTDKGDSDETEPMLNQKADRPNRAGQENLTSPMTTTSTTDCHNIVSRFAAHGTTKSSGTVNGELAMERQYEDDFDDFRREDSLLLVSTRRSGLSLGACLILGCQQDREQNGFWDYFDESTSLPIPSGFEGFHRAPSPLRWVECASDSHESDGDDVVGK